MRDHWRLVWAGLFGISLVISLLSFALTPSELQPSVLFFPTATNKGIEAEMHFLPRSQDAVSRVRLLVKAALSGPLSLKFSRIAPPECRVLAVFMREHTIYVDLGREFQNEGSDCPLAPMARLSILSKLIKFNESRMDRLVFLVQGKEVTNEISTNSRKS